MAGTIRTRWRRHRIPGGLAGLLALAIVAASPALAGPLEGSLEEVARLREQADWEALDQVAEDTWLRHADEAGSDEEARCALSGLVRLVDEALQEQRRDQDPARRVWLARQLELGGRCGGELTGFGGWVRIDLAQFALGEGEPARARRLLEEAMEIFGREGPRKPQDAVKASLLLATLAEDAITYENHLLEAARRIDFHPGETHPDLVGEVQWRLGLVRALDGDEDAAWTRFGWAQEAFLSRPPRPPVTPEGLAELRARHQEIQQLAGRDPRQAVASWEDLAIQLQHDEVVSQDPGLFFEVLQGQAEALEASGSGHAAPVLLEAGQAALEWRLAAATRGD